MLAANDRLHMQVLTSNSSTRDNLSQVPSKELALYYCQQWKLLQRELKRLKAQEDEYKTYLKKYLEYNQTRALMDENGYEYCTHTEYDTTCFNTSGFKKDHEKLYNAYCTKTTQSKLTLKL